jgi:excisionase family DNA binding protein
MIRATGVILTDEEARYLADVLDAACRAMRPSPRVADLARQLRRTVGTPAATNASANESANGRDTQPDPGDIRGHDLLTAGEAARILECSTANVRYLRQRGHLPAHRAGSRWLYPAAAVVARAERQAARRDAG